MTLPAADAGNAAPAADTSEADFNTAFDAASGGEGEGSGDGDGDEGVAGDGDVGGDAGSGSDATTGETSEEGQSREASRGDAEDEGASGDGDGSEEGDGTDPKVGEMLAELKRTNPKLYKEQQRYFTRRQQELGAGAKLLKALAQNPRAAVEQIVAELDKREGKSRSAASAATTEVSDEIKADLVAAVGAEQAEKLYPILKKIAAPVDQLRNDIAEKEAADNALVVEREMAAFAKDFPDYAHIKDDMDKVADLVMPAPGATYRQYMELVRNVVLGDKSVSERVNKLMAKAKKNAANRAPKTDAEPAGNVRPGGSKKIHSLEESFAMAERGETVGRGISR